MWTIHQPPSRVTSISKLDIGPSLTRRSGSSPKSTRSAKRRFNDSSGHASRGRCGRCDYYGGEYVRNVSGMARTLASNTEQDLQLDTTPGGVLCGRKLRRLCVVL